MQKNIQQTPIPFQDKNSQQTSNRRELPQPITSIYEKPTANILKGK